MEKRLLFFQGAFLAPSFAQAFLDARAPNQPFGGPLFRQGHPRAALDANDPERERNRIKYSASESEYLEKGLDQEPPVSAKAQDHFGSWSDPSWSELKNEWEQAFEGFGIVQRGKKAETESHPRIQLWRAMTDVNEYVCCVESKRQALRRLGTELAMFTKKPDPSKSFMLTAEPGSGKSYLVKQVAKSYHLGLLEFNITQMISKRDILECFDTIITRKQRDERPLLVFFDEINACLGGSYVYHVFLDPLGEVSRFVRGGKTFRIPPCVWLFAGTDDPSSHKDKSTKGKDFVSRLSLPPIAFKPGSHEKEQLRTEHVYLGVFLLKKAFPDVVEISGKALGAFEFLRPEVDVRKIQHMVSLFSDFPHKRILERNIPLDQFRDLTDNQFFNPHRFDAWKNLEEEETMIKIESEIPGGEELRREDGQTKPVMTNRAA